MSVYDHSDYKSYLKSIIEENQEVRGYQTKLASAAGCQRAYISQVLRGIAHLTPDQAVALCQYWNFDETQTDYYLELVSLARAGTQLLRDKILRRIHTIRSSISAVETRINRSEYLATEDQYIYYSSWHWAAVHVLSSIPSFQSATSISERLSMRTQAVEKTLHELHRMGVLNKNKNGLWSPAKKNLFLPRTSQMTHMNHTNWRLMALSDVHTDSGDSIHYSTLHALSKDDIRRLKTLLLNFIDDSKRIVEHSPEEEMVCVNCDLFVVRPPLE